MQCKEAFWPFCLTNLILIYHRIIAYSAEDVSLSRTSDTDNKCRTLTSYSVPV